ncbi:toll/interleukin-1 receptor domain-containing protein [Flavobacterium sp.]|uniref:toll/interleukin-1 receptor domain-containing protein n=1 Tax=Flavobacterium sp. TaxID=239 RepID=UPI00262B8A03|nr:toll/interleukin-1 receptor domain-containing protein [Flavobacterium sp.]
MIFLSHNYLDKAIVEPIAINLSRVFGMENVFYDSWSMQPGEGIIDRMNQGLEECKYFFFFVSKNSLASNMVKLEWQNALYKATQNKVKLIPVKLDDCLMPAILIQTLYIDIYGKGLEYGLSQIIDVINNKNTFATGVQTYENIRAYFTETADKKEIQLEIRAETYLEPISQYILLFENSKNEVKITSPELLNPTGDPFMENITVTNNYVCNGIYYYVNRATVPKFPIRFTIKSATDIPLKFMGVMRTVGENSARLVPLIPH